MNDCQRLQTMLTNMTSTSSPESAARKPFPPRDSRVLAQILRQAMVNSIDLWTTECSWVTLEGETARDRAWECFRDWARVQKAAGRSDAVSGVMISEELFHSVMAAQIPAPGTAGRYRLTVAAGFTAAKFAPPKTVSKRKPLPSRKQ